MVGTVLKRVGSNEYTGMLLVKMEFPLWKRTTLLARFMEKNGANTLFTCWGDACKQFAAFEIGRIYDLKIAGKCVKTNEGKYGVEGPFEVKMNQPCKMSVAKEGFPCEIPYNFQDFVNLNQMEHGELVDIIGRVMSVGVDDPVKKTITLFSKDLTQEVALLGQHAQTIVKVGDVVAVKGARLTVWKIYRGVSTGYMTCIEICPPEREGLVWPSCDDINEPKKKAIKLNLPAPITIHNANVNMRNLVSDFENGKGQPTLDFTVHGTIAPLTPEFFVLDAPFYEKGDEEKYLYKTVITDTTGQLHVKIWDKAGMHLFGVKEPRLRALWEEGLVDEDKQEDILDLLNATLTKKYIFCCSGKVWSKDSTGGVADINVSDVEESSA